MEPWFWIMLGAIAVCCGGVIATIVHEERRKRHDAWTARRTSMRRLLQINREIAEARNHPYPFWRDLTDDEIALRREVKQRAARTWVNQLPIPPRDDDAA